MTHSHIAPRFETTPVSHRFCLHFHVRKAKVNRVRQIAAAVTCSIVFIYYKIVLNSEKETRN